MSTQDIKMGLASKRKGRWRYRCWQKLFLALIGFPLAAGLLLVFVTIFRAVFVHQQNQSVLHVLNNQVVDKIDESQITQRAERLAGALKIPSVSYATDNQDKEALLQLHQYLEKSKQESCTGSNYHCSPLPFRINCSI